MSAFSPESTQPEATAPETIAPEAVPPSLSTIRAVQERLAPHIARTPTITYDAARLDPRAPAGGRVSLKLEFLQYTGSFKARGAINNLLALDAERRARGVTAVSAGNHAIAVAYAAKAMGVSAKVVMHKKANPARVAKCRRLGAEVVLADDIMQAFDIVAGLERDEGRTFVHPFEGESTVAGTATVGAEFHDQVPDLDAVIVAVGGGGLVAGIASATKAMRPTCQTIGVEPEGARGLTDSLAAGAPLDRVHVDTVADSMGAPLHTAGTLAICQQTVDRMVLVDDDAMCRAVAFAFDEMKLALEPAGAAALAALHGPLAQDLAGRHVGVVLCGSNIDFDSFAGFARRGGVFVP